MTLQEVARHHMAHCQALADKVCASLLSWVLPHVFVNALAVTALIEVDPEGEVDMEQLLLKVISHPSMQVHICRCFQNL